MRILVFGVGGVGGYFGGRLAQAGQDVVFVARGAQLRALREHGLTVESLKGDFRLETVTCTDRPADAGRVDAVLVCVKAGQLPEAAEALRPAVGPDTAVVPLENGVEAPDLLAAALGRAPVLGGLCQIISAIVKPGHIRHSGLEPYVALGELDGKPSERAERLRQALARAGVKAEVPADIQAALWRKFLFIAAFSGVGAVTRAPAGVMRSVPETRALLQQAVEEIDRVARARGVALPADAIQQTLDTIDRLPDNATASMQRDIIAGRPSELEAQNGAVVRLGRAAGVATPVNAFLYGCLLPQEGRAGGRLAFQV